MKTWTAIAVRQRGSAEWQRVPAAKVSPAEAQAMVAAREAETKVELDRRFETLMMREKR